MMESDAPMSIQDHRLIAGYTAVWLLGSVTLTQVGAVIGFIGGIAGLISLYYARQAVKEVRSALNVQSSEIDTAVVDKAAEIESKLREPLDGG